MRTFVLAVGWIAFATCSALAESPADAEKRAATELSGEMLECSMYYRIVATCMEGVPDTRVPETIRSLNDTASKVGELAVGVGTSAGISVDAQQAKSQTLRTELMNAIFGRCFNISILLHRYHNFCQRLVDHADLRRAELLQRGK